ncbi:hypothetical protein H310_09573 [Aphanomyces invadans]|uniref:Complex 1 LYR protein domain-containing protein n=1 Tax=Aphanomyces invadans TaxID=157072 RepID=A0A024TVN3_9STRA|nr:hypothetical protein H310_09573 [Aphanomyces invadans]ETV97686.1 hypothetical protein H310_09573 [Aphanomyces invadans]|eukprot:XP_008873895.1 hypothetical protein H310_09573 [Aphanomyces invadans]
MAASKLGGGSGGGLSFAYFINRSQVIKQYRLFLREIRPLAKETRQEVQQTIRAKFEATRHESNPTEVKRHLAYGHAQVQHVRELVNSVSATPTKPRPDVSFQETWTDAPPVSDDVNESQEDIKGRVGKGWPWSR